MNGLEGVAAAQNEVLLVLDELKLASPDDIAQGVLFAMTNTFLTGQTLHIDGGEPLT